VLKVSKAYKATKVIKVTKVYLLQAHKVLKVSKVYKVIKVIKVTKVYLLQAHKALRAYRVIKVTKAIKVFRDTQDHKDLVELTPFTVHSTTPQHRPTVGLPQPTLFHATHLKLSLV